MVEFLNTLSEQDKRVIEDFYNFHKNYPDMRISVSRIGQVIVDEVDQDGKIEKTIELSLFQDDFEIEDAPLCVAVNFLKDKGGVVSTIYGYTPR